MGTYKLKAEIPITKAVTLRSVTGASNTIIDANCLGMGDFRRCLSLNHSNVVVDGFTIQNGFITTYGACGAGVDVKGGL